MQITTCIPKDNSHVNNSQQQMTKIESMHLCFESSLLNNFNPKMVIKFNKGFRNRLLNMNHNFVYRRIGQFKKQSFYRPITLSSFVNCLWLGVMAIWFSTLLLTITLSFKCRMWFHFQYLHFKSFPIIWRTLYLNKVHSLHFCPKVLEHFKIPNSQSGS
jgi:hypothetical protein